MLKFTVQPIFLGLIGVCWQLRSVGLVSTVGLVTTA